MLIKDLITTVREDYLHDINEDAYLWSDKRLMRAFTEAERQVCNRGDYIYDDTTPQYTKITLVSGQASYSIDPKVTVIENIIFDGDLIERKSKPDMDVLQPTWRTDTTMTGNVIYAIISGRKIRFNRIPDADDDGLFVYLEVYRLPESDITNSYQSPEIPEENHRDLIYWVLHECYKKNDADGMNLEKSDYFLARFNEIFGVPVSAKVRQHQLENPRSLTIRPSPYIRTVNAGVDESQW